MAGLLLTLGCFACGTDSVGVSECRQIEQARCVAAAKCGSVEDVEACKAFYHDHCLHGLAIEEAPRAKLVNACVATIAAAGTCAAKQGAKTPPAECNDSTKLANSDARRVCDVVEEPELAKECSFLVPDPEDEDEDEENDESEEKDESEAEENGDAGSNASESDKNSGDAG